MDGWMREWLGGCVDALGRIEGTGLIEGTAQCKGADRHMQLERQPVVDRDHDASVLCHDCRRALSGVIQCKFKACTH